MSMKNSSETLGNRTRDLPACSAKPQAPASPGTAILTGILVCDGRECNVIFIGVMWTHTAYCLDILIVILTTVNPYVLSPYLFGEI